MKSPYDEAQIVVFGAPFDGTASHRPGSRFASSAMRMEFDGIETYSPLLNRDLEDYKIRDCGDLLLPFGNTGKALDIIEEYSKGLLMDDKIPFMIGGEHLVALPQIKALYEKFPNLHIIHLDAHTDIRDDYLGEKLSHATVIRRAWEIVGDGRIFAFGIRSGTREEFIWADRGHVQIHKFNLDGLDKIFEKLEGFPIYITLDIDVLDPSVLSGTGTPEAGGIAYKELEGLFLLMRNAKIVGADMVELSPHYDASGVSTAIACKILREMTLSIARKL